MISATGHQRSSYTGVKLRQYLELFIEVGCCEKGKRFAVFSRAQTRA